jgi:hypothetical protein
MGTQRGQIKRVISWLVRWTRRAGTMLGMKPEASGCRTGPPSYIGWRAGTSDFDAQMSGIKILKADDIPRICL